jgi:hypothetical protein
MSGFDGRANGTSRADDNAALQHESYATMVELSRVRVFLHILLTRPHRRNAARKASNGDLKCTTRDIRVSRSLYLWDRSTRQAADGLVIPIWVMAAELLYRL